MASSPHTYALIGVIRVKSYISGMLLDHLAQSFVRLEHRSIIPQLDPSQQEALLIEDSAGVGIKYTQMLANNPTPCDSYIIRHTARWQSKTLVLPWGL